MILISIGIILAIYILIALYKAFDQLDRLTPPDIDEEDITNDIHEG